MLFSGLNSLLKHSKWISELDPITKKAPFYCTGPESGLRSDALNALARLSRVRSENTVELPPFGAVPIEVLQVHPFNPVVAASGLDRAGIPQARDIDKIRATAEYQFGEGAGELIPENAMLKRSRESKRVRYVYEGKELLCVVRAHDSFLIPKKRLAEKLREKFKSPLLRVVLKDDADVVECVNGGKSVFAKFVAEADQNLRCGDECLIVDARDNLLRTGTLVLSPKEIKDFGRGMAVNVR
jgi:7-cyano-7-deazaguanine tRNA-ribosyltransferase